MKTILTTLLLLCLLATQSFPQWDWLNPQPHGNANNRIAFGSSSNDYTIVGKAGIIMKTTNDGVNWEIQNSGTDVNLNDVYISGNNAITVGNGGTVLGTTNGGTTWTAINSGTTTNLTAVTFATSAIGIITGWNGLILRTVNSGGSWTTVALPTTQRLYGVSFADANNGIAVGDGGVILKTTNGGADWNSLTSGTIQSLYDVSYVNSSTAVASGFNGTVIRTTNGGTTWNPIGLFTGTQWGVSFTDPDNGVVVGDGSVIARTTNGGINWANIFPPGGSFSNFYSVRFYNSTQGVVVGEWGGIFKTNDGGLTWEIVTKGIVDNQAPSGFVARNSFFEVQCINPSSAVILRSNGIYLTSDNAQTWNLSSISGNILLNGMHFMDMRTGTVVGTSSGSDVIMKTTNAGTDWVTQHSSTSGKLDAVSFASGNNGIVVGAGCRILGTTNGGQDWISPTI
ncbi:MAG TPA: YCF48-related protein, partial [Candidatus Dojkabacteria bacterium]|nr:YCF48-related protein [Candidatus Dojkabacteria bacterium]